MTKLIIGNSNIGYDTAEITKNNKGKYVLVSGTVAGRITWIKKAIANVNSGDYEFVTSSGDVLPVYLK